MARYERITQRRDFKPLMGMNVLCFLDLKVSSEFDQRKAAITEFNKVGLLLFCLNFVQYMFLLLM